MRLREVGGGRKGSRHGQGLGKVLRRRGGRQEGGCGRWAEGERPGGQGMGKVEGGAQARAA